MYRSFLDAALIIGNQICKQAYWYDDSCNWMGKFITSTENRREIGYMALDSSIYSGTSGIALFLAYLYKLTGQNKFFNTAKGAIRQALKYYDETEHEIRYGFYSGLVGVAFAAINISKVLKINELYEEGIHLLNTLYQSYKIGDHILDIISGNAGAIPALLQIYNKWESEEKLYELAIKLGDELIKYSTRDWRGWSWNSHINQVPKIRHNLTGFSHGAAGFGTALLELYANTDNKEFLYGGMNAFRYENSWYNKKVSNWPDFRLPSSRDHHSFPVGIPYSNAWCHGAPGIGLSRLRGYQILKKKKYLDDSNNSLKTSIKIITSTLNPKTILKNHFDYSLCHGLTGVCETLLIADEIFETNSYSMLCKKVGKVGLNEFLEKGKEFHCGGPESGVPGLMLGLAGIGYFFLRLSSKEIPSLLLITSN
ncbi:MAG: lanthionine synthetase LanC family protein [Candidatus Nitrosocosmicus sp.]